MRKQKLLLLIAQAIPSLIALNVHDSNECILTYLHQQETKAVTCTLEEYEQAANPQYFINRTLDNIYAQI